jgi:hypothetical protein
MWFKKPRLSTPNNYVFYVPSYVVDRPKSKKTTQGRLFWYMGGGIISGYPRLQPPRRSVRN